MSIDALRRDYDAEPFDETDALADPVAQFRAWFDEAVAAQRSSLEMKATDVNAMTLATADAEGRPSARVVLLKGLSEAGFVFYTNHTSRKAAELVANPRAALAFYWGPLHRQVRVNGRVERVSDAAAAAYFKTRPRGSQIGAWASAQSSVLDSRQTLEQQFAETEQRFEGQDVPLPEFWGGYCVAPEVVEFWQGRPSRLHDRLRYTKQADGSWVIERLSP